MKTKILLLFMTVFALTFSACSDDEGGGSNEMTVMLRVVCILQGSETETPDSNSKVYVFRGTEFINSKYEYKGEGRFYNKENGHNAEAKQSLSMENKVVIPIKCSYDCTIVVESEYYKGSYAIKTKLLSDSDKNIKVIFPVKE